MKEDTRYLPEKTHCDICATKFESDYDKHNAEPVKTATCCTICNDTVVIPALNSELNSGLNSELNSELKK